MHVVVLVPGIMGSRLALNGTEVWPPTAGEFVFGYDRLPELMTTGVIATDLIREASCVNVYDSLIDRLHKWGFHESAAGGTRGRLICWPYDWRIDVRDSAGVLSSRLRDLVAEIGADTRISLLVHSMGGLVARYALEVLDAPRLGNTTWRSKVDLVVTLATPHRGAPLALVRALGQEGSTGVSPADIRTFSSDPRYPSVYQLLPPANANAFWATGGAPNSLPSINVLDDVVATALGLDLKNIAAARDVYQALDSGTRPNCRYFNFIGRTLDTVVRCDFRSPTAVTSTSFSSGGDGTVPIWSGTQQGTQFDLEGEEHSHTFHDPKVLATLGPLLGVPAAIVMAMAAPASPLQIRLPSQVFSARVNVRITAIAHGIPSRPLEIAIHQTDENGVLAETPTSVTPVGMTPPSGDLTAIVELALPARPGWYAAVLRTARAADAPQIQSDGERFAVQRVR
jgi:hypothetical protein